MNSNNNEIEIEKPNNENEQKKEIQNKKEEEKRKNEQEDYNRLNGPLKYKSHGWSMIGDEKEKDDKSNSIIAMKNKDPSYFVDGFYTHKDNANYNIHFEKGVIKAVPGKNRSYTSDSPEEISLMTDFLKAAGCTRLEFELEYEGAQGSMSDALVKIRDVMAAAALRDMAVDFGSTVLEILKVCGEKERIAILETQKKINEHHDNVRLLSGMFEVEKDKKFAGMNNAIDDVKADSDDINKELTDAELGELDEKSENKEQIEHAEKQIQFIENAFKKNETDVQKLNDVLESLDKEQDEIIKLVDNPGALDLGKIEYLNINTKPKKGVPEGDGKKELLNKVEESYDKHQGKVNKIFTDVEKKNENIEKKNAGWDEKLKAIKNGLEEKNKDQNLSVDEKKKITEQIKKIEKIQETRDPNSPQYQKPKNDLKKMITDVKKKHEDVPKKIEESHKKIEEQKNPKLNK